MPTNVVMTAKQQQELGAAPDWHVAESLLTGAAALVVGVALIVVLGIIPPVRDIWAPQVRYARNPDLAVPALWASVLVNLTLAGVLVGAVRFGAMRYRAVRWLLLILAAGALLQALLYLDASVGESNLSRAVEAELKSLKVWGLVVAVSEGVGGLLVLAGSTIARQRSLGGTPAVPWGRWTVAGLLAVAGAIMLTATLFFAEELEVIAFLGGMAATAVLLTFAILVVLHGTRRRTFAWMAALAPVVFIVAAVAHNVEFAITEVEGGGLLLTAILGAPTLLLAGIAGLLWTLVQDRHGRRRERGPAARDGK